MHGYLPQRASAPWHEPAPDALVFTDAQYWASSASPHSYANRVMATALHDSHCVFVGTSMSDVNVLRWLAYPVAYGIAYVAGIAWSYAANTLFVFRTRPSLRRAAMFPFVYVAQYVVGTALLVALVDGAGVPRALAPAVVIVVTIPMTYLLSKRILHGRRRNETLR